MQSVDGYPAELDVVDPSALVIVNGEPLEAESISVSRELSSSMPSQVDAGSGITAATGSVTWAVGEDVKKRSSHQWDGSAFPPRPSDEVVVFAGYGEALVRQLTGSIDDAQGSIASGEVSSGLVDPIDKLNRTVAFPAILDVMPPPEDWGAFVRVGLRPTFITDRILRACGFFATPGPSSGCVFSAPHMGSAWPEIGTVDRSHAPGPSGMLATESPSYATTPWGVGLSGGDSHYTPDLGRVGGNGRLSRTMQLTLKVATDPSEEGESYVRALWGSAWISLTVTSDRAVRAVLNNGEGFGVPVCTLSSAAASGADVFTARVTPGGAFTVLGNNGQSVSGSASLPSAITGTHMDAVRVYATDGAVRIGGAQINFGQTNVVNSEQTAHLTPAAASVSLPAFPRIEPHNALDLLKEQAEAECAAMWIDEHGHFRWVNRNVLANTAPTATLTALDDVLDIGWESNAKGVRSRAVLTSRRASISRSRLPNLIAWQGRGESLEAGQENEEIASADSDTDWIDVDENLKVLTVTGNFSIFNRGQGTWAGGVATDDEGSQWATIGNPGFSVDLEKIADSAYRFATSAGTPPTDHTVELRTPDNDATTAIWQSKRNFDLPVLRAKAIVGWEEREITGIHPGPPAAATLEHDVGPWVQHTPSLQILADWLSSQVREPRPVLRNLSVIPDFRRQLADVVWVEDGENMGIRIKLLITKISTSVSVGSADQVIGGRILEVQNYRATNQRLDEHASGRTNTGFDTLWADATNAQLDDNPLGRG